MEENCREVVRIPFCALLPMRSQCVTMAVEERPTVALRLFLCTSTHDTCLSQKAVTRPRFTSATQLQADIGIVRHLWMCPLHKVAIASLSQMCLTHHAIMSRFQHIEVYQHQHPMVAVYPPFARPAPSQALSSRLSLSLLCQSTLIGTPWTTSAGWKRPARLPGSPEHPLPSGRCSREFPVGSLALKAQGYPS